MSVRTIVTYPADVLRRPTAPVSTFDDGLAQLIDDMFATMYAAPGVGLAAPQVGESQQVLVMDPGADSGVGPLALVNPRIVASAGEITWEEGCLSIPGFTAEVTRAARISVAAHDRHGQPLTLDFDDFPAVVVQHEIDHLEGTLFVDRISRTRQRLFEKDFGADPYRWKYGRKRG